jgi:hypothetical protein
MKAVKEPKADKPKPSAWETWDVDDPLHIDANPLGDHRIWFALDKHKFVYCLLCRKVDPTLNQNNNPKQHKFINTTAAAEHAAKEKHRGFARDANPSDFQLVTSDMDNAVQRGPDELG